MLCTSQWLRLRLLLVASHVAPIRSWLEEFFYPQDDNESVLMINKTRSLSDFSNMIEFCQFICSNSWLIRVGWQSLTETSGEKDHPSCSFHHICECSMYPKIRGLLSCSLVLCSHHQRTPWIQRRLSMKYLKKYEWFKSPMDSGSKSQLYRESHKKTSVLFFHIHLACNQLRLDHVGSLESLQADLTRDQSFREPDLWTIWWFQPQFIKMSPTKKNIGFFSGIWGMMNYPNRDYNKPL